MTEDQKKQMAAFRFGVIGELVNRASLDHGEKERLLREKCARKWTIPFSGRTRISRTTMLRWIRAYESGRGRLEALYPQDRKDRGKSRSLDEETGLALIALRKELPGATAGRLMAEMQRRGWITPGIALTRSTLYRFLHQHDLMGRPASIPEDRRKYEAELPNDLWQADVMHGPRVDDGGKMKKTYLIAIIDDHSRLIPYGRFYTSEKLICWLDALENALARRGLPRKLYVDNGSAFRSKQVEAITASLGISLIHSRPYKPQGKGKIERWFKTVRSSFLADYSVTTMDRLNRDFLAWVDGYHQKKHTGTSQAPLARFAAHTPCLRHAPENLRDYFRQTVLRRVAKDRTVTINGRLFEAPVRLIGKRVTLCYHDDHPEAVEVVFNGQSHGMIPLVDIHVNGRVKRDKNSQAELTSAESRYQGGRLWGNGGKNE